MKANELMIGNIITHKDFNTCLVSEISELTFRSTKGDDSLLSYFNDDKWSYVPLDEGWLKRFGVIQHAMNKFEHIETGLDMQCSYELKYVHQLQNLYFALTGQEL